VAVGDFNGDGTLDLAVANDNGVSVLLGNGDGTFQPAVNYAAGVGPSSVAVGDFNGDGTLDLAVANDVSNGTVSVLLGNGDGSFGAATSYAAGSYPRSVAVGDFNRDGIPDLVVANGGVSVLLGNGDASFEAPVSYFAGVNSVSVAVADLNGDGILDLAVANAGSYPYYPDGSVGVLLGNGDGNFQAAVTYYAGYSPNSVAVGDFNGDGVPDLAVTGYYSTFDYFYPSIDVLLGTGTGAFVLSHEYGPLIPHGPDAVAVADVNGDGIPDLVTGNYTQSRDGVDVFLGNGDGSFQTGLDYLGDFWCASVAVGDFNSDGFLDLATADPLLNEVSVRLNDGHWGGTSPGPAHGPSRPKAQAAPAASPLVALPSSLLAAEPLPGPSAVLPAPGETASGQTSVPASPPLAPPRAQDLGDQVLPRPAPAAETVAGLDWLSTVALDGPVRVLSESL
jgi:hypothetical protein